MLKVLITIEPILENKHFELYLLKKDNTPLAVSRIRTAAGFNTLPDDKTLNIYSIKNKSKDRLPGK